MSSFGVVVDGFVPPCTGSAFLARVRLTLRACVVQLPAAMHLIFGKVSL